MVNYQLGKIYKIYSHIDPSLCYVGSTCRELLCQRMNGHRSDYIKWKDGKVNKVTSYDLFDKFGVENCIIELIENYPCDSRDQLSKKEGEYIKSLNCVNKCITGRLPKEYKQEWYIRNHETLLLKQKVYSQQNKEHIATKQNNYRKQNKEHIANNQKNYYKENKESLIIKCKNYYEENKETIATKTKLYREQNKEAISLCNKLYREKNKEKILMKKREYYEKQKLKKIF